MPSEARPELVTVPVAISCLAMLVTVSLGIAKPIPAAAPPSWGSVAASVGMPMTFPAKSTSAPPLLPGLIAALVWMALIRTGELPWPSETVRPATSAAATTASPAATGTRPVTGWLAGKDWTVSHPYLTRLGDAAVRRETLDAARQITAVTGKSPVPLFRFPFGDANARTIAIANQAGDVPVRWTVDTLGWEGTAGHITSTVVASRVLGAAQPGEIVLMHVGSNPDDHTTLDADAPPKARYVS